MAMGFMELVEQLTTLDSERRGRWQATTVPQADGMPSEIPATPFAEMTREGYSQKKAGTTRIVPACL
jgi:hypothetical protein